MSNSQNNNPAIQRLTSLPPALLEEIVEKPEALSALARVWTAINLEKENQNFDNMSPAQRNSHLDRCIKLGWTNQANGQAGAGRPQFTLEINMGAEKMTLKATPTKPNMPEEREEKTVVDADLIEEIEDAPASLTVSELDQLLDADFSLEIDHG